MIHESMYPYPPTACIVLPLQSSTCCYSCHLLDWTTEHCKLQENPEFEPASRNRRIREPKLQERKAQEVSLAGWNSGIPAMLKSHVSTLPKRSLSAGDVLYKDFGFCAATYTHAMQCNKIHKYIYIYIYTIITCCISIINNDARW